MEEIGTGGKGQRLLEKYVLVRARDQVGLLDSILERIFAEQLDHHSGVEVHGDDPNGTFLIIYDLDLHCRENF